MPLLRFVPSSITDLLFNQERHLVYPTTQSERDQVMGMLDSYLTRPSTHYAFGDIPFSPQDILDKLDGLTPDTNPINNDDGTELKKLLLNKASLGNAMTLIEKCHERFQDNKNLIDFNLDGDRGYSYLCWTQHQNPVADPSDFPGKLEVSVPVKLNFIK